ncbi:MAG: extracellular solute-binding protein [Bacilli bacterium]
MLQDIEASADVFSMADDQVLDLYNAGALQNIEDVSSTIASDVKSRNNAGSVTASTKDGKLVAFPATADNGYFVYYDSSILAKSDLANYETMFAKLKAQSTDTMKYVYSFQFDSGWYLDGFFSGAGTSAVLDSTTGKTVCDWNNAKGLKAAEGILNLTCGEYKDYFYNLDDVTFASDTGRTETYRVAAGCNGIWNSSTVEANYGANYAATKLPEYKVDGSYVQQRSIAGFKLFGVNKYSKNTKWAVELANFLTTEDAEAARFTTMGAGPSNTVAASSDAVKANVALSGLIEQSAYGNTQSVSGSFWDASKALASALYSGMNGDTDLIKSGRGTFSITFDEAAIQDLLDTAVAAIEA